MKNKIYIIGLFAIGILVLWQMSWYVPSIKNYYFEQTFESLCQHTVEIVEPIEVANQTDSIIFLDARQLSEYQVSHIKNARWIGYEEFTSNKITDLDTLQKIIIYCSIGYRSEKIGEKLKNLGFKNVYNLKGGIFKWLNEGYPIYRNQQTTFDIHPFDEKWGIWLNKGNKTYKPQ